MAEQPNQSPQTPPEEENENAEVYSVSQNKNGSFHFSRRDFLMLGMAAGGALLVKGVCPRFGAGDPSTTNQTVQAGMLPLPKVYLHTKPSIDSNIVDTLQQNDIVLLLGDHPDLNWVEVSTQAGQRGWLMRRFVDFSRAITQASQDFVFSSPLKSCSEIIQNGGFEAGLVSWVEDSSHGIITNSWADPYQGSWVALLGGGNSLLDKLTQLFHLPADVDDLQTIQFYLKVTTEETSSFTVYDKLVVRLLNASGSPILIADTVIATNLTPMDWSHRSIQLTGLASYADQDIQIQFEATTDSSLITNFVIDMVSLNLTCGSVPPTPTNTPSPANYIYLPIIVNAAPPTPTEIPTSTPCPSHVNPCSCNSNPCSCNSSPCVSNSFCPPVGNCPLYVVPCPGNSFCPPVGNCPLFNLCTCNTNPCSCNAYPCFCNYNPCSCNTAPCSCNAYPCFCNYNPCSCNTSPVFCACNAFPCFAT
jgi:uncharacterized protein YgiM (DUF1202 family)